MRFIKDSIESVRVSCPILVLGQLTENPNVGDSLQHYRDVYVCLVNGIRIRRLRGAWFEITSIVSSAKVEQAVYRLRQLAARVACTSDDPQLTQDGVPEKERG